MEASYDLLLNKGHSAAARRFPKTPYAMVHCLNHHDVNKYLDISEYLRLGLIPHHGNLYGDMFKHLVSVFGQKPFYQEKRGDKFFAVQGKQRAIFLPLLLKTRELLPWVP